MVTNLGNKIAFNSFGSKGANSVDSFMHFSTWNGPGERQCWFYNQETSPFYSLTTISMGAFIGPTTTSPDHSIKVS